MRTMLVTGAAGFIGRAAVNYYSRAGWHVIGMDDLSRPGGRQEPGVEFYVWDVRNIDRCPLPYVDAVLHLAAQASVTRSVASPLADFRANAEATLRLCLWAKRHHQPPIVIYSSTNKVFGELNGQREPIHDEQMIAPVTPYGISKAMADLYVREMLPETGFVFRQSCIYGETQRGSEDQGWVAHIASLVAQRRGITCYGDGGQVRDLLHVEDLFAAYDLALEQKLSARACVIGGGITNAHSFAGLVKRMGGEIVQYGPWRPHDQRWFVSANDSFPTLVPRELDVNGLLQSALDASR